MKMIERRVLARLSLHNMLPNLTAESEKSVAMYISPSSFPTRINALLDEASITSADKVIKTANNEIVIKEAAKYQTGAVIFWDRDGYIILPPFPINEDRVLSGKFGTSLLAELLEQEHTVGIVLVTWGSYSIGVFDNGNLIASKVGTGHIHKEHKKGGSSQKRFARRTEEQKKSFLRRVSNRVEETLSKHSLDYIFFGGNRLIRRPLWQECRYLESQADKVSGRILDIRYANRATLNNSLSETMKSVVFVFRVGND